jgi:hypothetical protein
MRSSGQSVFPRPITAIEWHDGEGYGMLRTNVNARIADDRKDWTTKNPAVNSECPRDSEQSCQNKPRRAHIYFPDELKVSPQQT